MGNVEPQKSFFQAVTLGELVPQDHPFRKIRPLIDTERIRELCADYYCADNGRPSLPPEQLFLAWLGGYLMGCRSDRKLVMQLQVGRREARQRDRNGILVGMSADVFRGSMSEREGALSLIERAKRKLGLKPKTLGGDKGYFEGKLMSALDDRGIKPHIATLERANQPIHLKVKWMVKTLAYQASQRARKRIEELWGEGKEQHGLRRFACRGLERVRQEALMIGWLLNLERLASLQAAV